MKKHITLLLFLGALLFCSSQSARAQAPGIDWQKTIGGTGTDLSQCVQQTPDGGFVVAGTLFEPTMGAGGTHGYNVSVTRLSATGGEVWQRVYGGPGNDYGYAIRNTSDGGFIVAASTNSTSHHITENHGGYDMWALKLSAAGDIEWQNALGGYGNEAAYDVRQTFDSGYILVGHSSSADGHLTENKGGFDMWAVKLSKTGALQWQHSFGGGNDDNLLSVIQTADSGYMVAGDTYSSGGDIVGHHGFEDSWVAKLSKTGDLLWQKCYGGAIADYAQSIRPTPDGNFIVAGGSNSIDGDITANMGAGDVWVMKIAPTGNIIWQKNYGSTANDGANSIEVTADGGFLVAGYASANNGNVSGFTGGRDYWLLKLAAAGAMQWQKCLNNTGYNDAGCAIQTAGGDYVVAGTTNTGNSDGWVVALSHSVNVTETPLASSISIYPNPTSGQLYLQGISQAHITVSNMLGSTLVQASNTDQVDISALAAGVYMVTVAHADGTLIDRFKVLKQ